VVWRDDDYTNGVQESKTSVRTRRVDAETTTATKDQVIDAGGNNVSLAGGFTLPDNAITRISVLHILKKNSSGEGGTIEAKAGFYRGGGNPPTLIGWFPN
jgi:hypothetical protein